MSISDTFFAHFLMAVDVDTAPPEMVFKGVQNLAPEILGSLQANSVFLKHIAPFLAAAEGEEWYGFAQRVVDVALTVEIVGRDLEGKYLALRTDMDPELNDIARTFQGLTMMLQANQTHIRDVSNFLIELQNKAIEADAALSDEEADETSEASRLITA